MIVAIMQPYFFPYIGYWQLIHAADCFVLFDDAQYMRHGWVNRNRILKPGGGWQYILVPLKKHGMTDSIKTIQADSTKRWKELIIRQLDHYKKKAPHYIEVSAIVSEALSGVNDHRISAINRTVIEKICDNLEIETTIVTSSEMNFTYSDVSEPGEWALRISEQLGASEYINPAGGADLFDPEKFTRSNIKLSFLNSHDIVYDQFGLFEPDLSIIDVLMFNGIDGTKDILRKYFVSGARI